MTGVRRKTGHSLAGTMIFLVLVMLLWTTAGRQLASHLRTDKACVVHREKSTGCRRAMAWALTLLETGEPPVGSTGWCARRMIVDGKTYVVIYVRTAPGQYRVDVRPATSWLDSFWPVVPRQF